MFCCICSATAREDSSNPSNNLQLFKCPKSVEKYSTNSSPFVCSLHFASMYMREEDGEVWLRTDAIPTLALPMISNYNDHHFKSPFPINSLSSRKLGNSSSSQSVETTFSLTSSRIRNGPNNGNQSSPTNNCSLNKAAIILPNLQASKTAVGTIESSLPATESPQWATSLRPEYDDICGEPIWSFATNQDLETFASLSIGQQKQILSSTLLGDPEKTQESTEPSLTDTVKPADLPGSTNNEMGESLIEERARLQRLDRSRSTPKRVRHSSRQQLMTQLKIKDDQIAHLKRQVRRLKKQIATSESSSKEEKNDVQMTRPSVLRLSQYIPDISTGLNPSSTETKQSPEEIIIIE